MDFPGRIDLQFVHLPPDFWLGTLYSLHYWYTRQDKSYICLAADVTVAEVDAWPEVYITTIVPKSVASKSFSLWP